MPSVTAQRLDTVSILRPTFPPERPFLASVRCFKHLVLMWFTQHLWHQLDSTTYHTWNIWDNIVAWGALKVSELCCAMALVAFNWLVFILSVLFLSLLVFHTILQHFLPARFICCLHTCELWFISKYHSGSGFTSILGFL